MTTDEFGRVILGGSLLIAVVVALGTVSDPPAPDPTEPVAVETPAGEVILQEKALDTAYAEPEPAPSYVDSAALCRVRANLYGIAVPVGDPERAFARCDSALSAEGEPEWRNLVGANR